ncbi:MAG: SHOCT domain-containing protein, partial [Solirubrobacteraceae bacterium]
ARIVALITAWGPPPATRKPLGMLLFAILLFAGVEVLRRQVRREHPEASFGELGHAMSDRFAALRGRVTAGGHAVTSRVSGRHGEAAPAVAAPNGSRLEQLERLGRLRESGVLGDAEFAREKAALLGEPVA